MTSLPAFFVRLAALLGATVAVLAVAVSMMGKVPLQAAGVDHDARVASAGKP